MVLDFLKSNGEVKISLSDVYVTFTDVGHFPYLVTSYTNGDHYWTVGLHGRVSKRFVTYLGVPLCLKMSRVRIITKESG